MIKTTTLFLSQEPTLTQPREAVKRVRGQAKEFGPSEFTIQNILNYSKALQVMSPASTDTVFGVMN